MSLLVIPGKDGYSFLGQDGGSIGPARAFYDTVIPANETGTVAASGATVTGTGTSFDTVFVPSDYIEINDTVPKIFYVSAVGSATSLTIADPDTFEPVNVTITAGKTFKKVTAMDMGRTNEDGITLKVTEKTAGVKSSDDGDVNINDFSTGTECQIEMTLIEVSQEKLNKLMEGAVDVTRDTDGRILAMAFGDRVGRDFKKNSKQLTLIAYRDGAISTEGSDRVDFFKVHFESAIEIQRNASAVHMVKLIGRCYKDDTKKVDGKSKYFAVNPAEMVFD